MDLYPPPGGVVTFEQMEEAAWKVINKAKNYPKGSVTGIATIMREVYKDRIFAWRFATLFGKRHKVRGGAISRTGIVMVYNDYSKRYTWDQITSLNVTRTTVINQNSTSGQSGDRYDIHFIFGPDEGFRFNAEVVRSYEFPRDISYGSDQKYMANMCALYYNRVRAERMQRALQNGNKRVLLHHDYNQEYGNEILRRFNSPEGVRMKFFRQKVVISRAGILHTKGRRKVMLDLKWADVEEVILGLGATNPLIQFRMKPGCDPPRNYFAPYGWKMEPPMPQPNRTQQQHIIPLCWLNV